MTTETKPATDEEIEAIRHALREGSMPCQRYFASLLDRIDYEREHASANHAATIAERERAEKAEYELRRWQEVKAQQPDYEKLWAEQVERADRFETDYGNVMSSAQEHADFTHGVIAERDALAAQLAEALRREKNMQAVAVEQHAQLAEARQQIAALREALGRIAQMRPATCDTSLAHEMADVADAALAQTAPEHNWAGGNDGSYCRSCGTEYDHRSEPAPTSSCQAQTEESRP